MVINTGDMDLVVALSFLSKALQGVCVKSKFFVRTSEPCRQHKYVRDPAVKRDLGSGRRAVHLSAARGSA